MLNVTIVWPNLCLYKGKRLWLSIEDNCWVMVIKDVRLHVVALLIPPSSGWSTVEPRLSKSPLSEPSVIRTLFQILKSQKTVRFSAKPSNKWNACVIFRLVRPNSYIIVQWVEKHVSMCDIVGRPRNKLTVMCKNIIVYS